MILPAILIMAFLLQILLSIHYLDNTDSCYAFECFRNIHNSLIIIANGQFGFVDLLTFVQILIHLFLARSI